ncbi:MAG TPA: hypothetical protein VFM70_01330 [Salinimicrobium sp.]|nr:hypothetical protein [Salinimicrobium sp.]
MDNFVILKQKLEEFIRKFYINQLIKGGILFVGISLLYLILLLSVEYFLWLNPLGRTIMFWSFVSVSVFLICKFLIIPLFKLFRISKGINYTDASKMIGSHFPQVNDKLLNVLQLKNNSEETELLIAGINQKIKEMEPVPFKSAIDFRGNWKYAKFAFFPLLIVLLIYISGNINMLSESYQRVVNYEVAYQPPAPFSYFLLNPNLTVEENADFLISVEVKGNYIPEDVSINYGGQSYFLEQKNLGRFEYTFQKVDAPIQFYFSANEIESKQYQLNVVEVPKMLNFEMFLDFPAYTKKQDISVHGSGNSIVPEGTKVKWVIATESTDKIILQEQDTLFYFNEDNGIFQFEKRAFQSFEYQIKTSNDAVKDYEKLSYGIQVIKDNYPQLFLESKRDSVDSETYYFKGRATDDYGISNVKLVYYGLDAPNKKASLEIQAPKSNLLEFLYVFPGNIDLTEGKSYQFYFEVFDNDAINASKSVKSKVYDFRKRTNSEIVEQNFENQKESIEGMNNSLEKLKFSEEELQKIMNSQKENRKLDFNDQRRLKDFLERQKKQEEILRQHQEKLKNSFKEKLEEEDFKKELERRLENSEKELQENEKLREELEDYIEKINEEELGRKLEEMSKKSDIQKRNMEQLLELTKRYYVQEKQRKIAEDLEELTRKQEALSEKTGEENSLEEQKRLTQEFQNLEKEMEELQKENEKLKAPMEIPENEELEKEIQEEQKDAEEELGKKEKSAAKKHQKEAAKKMQEMQKKMEMGMEMQGGEAMMEDAEMLRQILDNLVKFSFEQEDLLEDFREMPEKSPKFSSKLREQNILKVHFQHVDDSLYSLALRNPMVKEDVFKKLSDVEFYLDKSLELIAENQIRQGIGSQQYVITAANDLAVMLSQLLESMKNASASGSGSGKSGGKGFQLPDIIKKQGELGEKMGEGLKKGEKGKTGEGEKGQQGEGKQQGEGEGKNGNSGEGENGKGGEKNGNGSQMNSEKMSGEIFQIYKEQQQLRQQLQDRMQRDGFSKEENSLLRRMEEVEQDLLRKGFDGETMRKMESIKHRLLELDKALLKQGEEQKRESETGKRDAVNQADELRLKAKEYFDMIEILNRQALPLREIYKLKVEDYFDAGNH